MNAIFNASDSEKNSMRLVMLHEFALMLNSAESIEQVLHRSAKMLREIMMSHVCHIVLADYLKNDFKLKTAILDGFKDFPPGVDETKGISGLAFSSGIIINVPDVSKDPRVNPKMSEWFGNKSLLSVPIKVKDRAIGSIVICSGELNFFQEDDGFFLLMLGNHLGLAVENAHLLSEIKKSAISDALTDVYNSRYFRDTLAQLTSENPNDLISLIMLDINNFKYINDNYGHTTGDFILKEVALIISNTVGKKGIVARYGGDEFAVIVPKLTEDKVQSLAKRIDKNIRVNTFYYKGFKMNISPSWGLGTTLSRNIPNINTFIDLADERLYRMKKETKFDSKPTVENIMIGEYI